MAINIESLTCSEFCVDTCSMLNIHGNTVSYKTTHRGLRSCMNVSTHESVGNFVKILVQHFAYVKNNWLLKKYAKPKIFMPTTSKNCQISKIWHKNMPLGITGGSTIALSASKLKAAFYVRFCY